MSGAISFETARELARKWFADNVGLETVLADQADPRRQKPYAMLRVTSGPQALGRDELRPLDADPTKFVVCGQRRFLVAFTVFGPTLQKEQDDGIQSAQGYCQRALDAISDPAVYQTLFESGLSIHDKTAVQNSSQLLDVEFEDRATFNMTFGYAMEKISDPGIIEEVGFTGDLGVPSVPVAGDIHD